MYFFEVNILLIEFYSFVNCFKIMVIPYAVVFS